MCMDGLKQIWDRIINLISFDEPKTSYALMDPFLCFPSWNLMSFVGPKNLMFLMDPSPLETSCLLMDPKNSCFTFFPLLKPHVFWWTQKPHVFWWTLDLMSFVPTFLSQLDFLSYLKLTWSRKTQISSKDKFAFCHFKIWGTLKCREKLISQ